MVYLIIAIWTLSLIYGSLNILWFFDLDEEDEQSTYKKVNIPCRFEPALGFAVFDFVLTFVVPLVVMLIVYIEIFLVVHSQMKKIQPHLQPSMNQFEIKETTFYERPQSSSESKDAVVPTRSRNHSNQGDENISTDLTKETDKQPTANEHTSKPRFVIGDKASGNHDIPMKNTNNNNDYLNDEILNKINNKSQENVMDMGDKYHQVKTSNKNTEVDNNNHFYSVKFKLKNSNQLHKSVSDSVLPESSTSIHKDLNSSSCFQIDEANINIETDINLKHCQETVNKERHNKNSKKSKRRIFSANDAQNSSNRNHHSSISSTSQSPPPSAKSRRTMSATSKTMRLKPRINNKAIKLSITVIGTFILCYAPYEVTFLIERGCSTCIGDIAWMIVNTLAFLSSAVNPFVYSLLSSEFSTAMQNLLCCDRNGYLCRRWK